MSSEIATLDALRSLYAAPRERALKKELRHLDRHCRAFIALASFAVVSTGSAAGAMDASPRGGEPGFIKVGDDTTLLIPDAPGNNRLDTLENIIATGRVGLLFLIPGVDETLRVNGNARVVDTPKLLEEFSSEKRKPKLIIEVAVEDVYLHCAKALMRSKLWSSASQVERSVLPTMGQMLNDQTGTNAPAETQAEMAERYKADL